MPRKYRDEELVELLARGDLTHREVGEKLGLSESYVYRVARGQRRPELQEAIAETARMYVRQARLLGARWVRSVLSRHIRIGLEGDGETARKCREYTLNRFLEGVDMPEPAGTSPADSLPVPREDAAAFYRWKSQTDGGPDPAVEQADPDEGVGVSG